MTDGAQRPFLFTDPDDDLDETDRGLVYDLGTLDRRQVLKLLGFGGVTASLFTIVGCGPGGGSSASTGATASVAAPTDGSTASCALIPEETAGPYPADGSNGPNVLTESGVVRSDITTSFGGSSGTADGVPLSITLTIQDSGTDCAPLAGAAVYLWQCDRAGNYSLYSQDAADQNYLRGVQEADDNGNVTFQSIYPAAYSGRWPHIHFEVYPSLELATDETNRIATSQIALPKDASDAVYATAGYEQSVSNMERLSLEGDNVFGDDGGAKQLGTVTGSVADGYAVTLVVPVGT